MGNTYLNRAMLNSRSNEREVETKGDEKLKKSRRRVHDLTNKCKDVGLLDEACELLKRGSAIGSTSGS